MSVLIPAAGCTYTVPPSYRRLVAGRNLESTAVAIKGTMASMRLQTVSRRAPLGCRQWPRLPASIQVGRDGDDQQWTRHIRSLRCRFIRFLMGGSARTLLHRISMPAFSTAPGPLSRAAAGTGLALVRPDGGKFAILIGTGYGTASAVAGFDFSPARSRKKVFLWRFIEQLT